MKKALIAAVIVIVAAAGGTHLYYMDRGRFTTEPVYEDLGRSVADNRLTSSFDPAVVLRFDEAFDYLGGQKFALYGVADTEQYFFVETHADGTLKSVYWIQFEAYLADNSYTYDYDDSPLRSTIGDYEFYTDTAVVEFDPDKKRAGGTDGAMARQFLAKHGYVFPGNFAYARLVFLTDDSRRKELMIIYIDDLAARGFTAAELLDGGSKTEQRDALDRAHLDRIEATLDVAAAGDTAR